MKIFRIISIACIIVLEFFSMQVAVFAIEKESKSTDELLLEYGMTQEEISELDEEIKQYIIDNLAKSDDEEVVYIPGKKFVYFPDKDEILNDFLGLHLRYGEMSEYIMSETIVEFSQELGQKSTDISDKLECYVYRFGSKGDREGKCQTILDLSCTQELLVNKKDVLYLDAEDIIWTEENIEGEVWAKQSMEDSWECKAYIAALPGEEHAVEITGGQWKTGEEYFRILLCLNSVVKKQEEGNAPRYLVGYKNVVTVFPYKIVLLSMGTIIVIGAVMIMGRKKLC